MCATRASNALKSDEVVPRAVPRVDVLGIGVSAIDLPQALGIIDGWIARCERHYVCVTGVHGVMESQRDDELRQIHNEAGLVTPDGMPLVWISRLRGFPHVDRVYGPDLMLAASERSVARRRPPRGSSGGALPRSADRGYFHAAVSFAHA